MVTIVFPCCTYCEGHILTLGQARIGDKVFLSEVTSPENILGCRFIPILYHHIHKHRVIVWTAHYL